MTSVPETPLASSFALEARGVHKRFGGTHALQDADLLLRAGAVHALLGGNGSGKSTMIKCLTGVYRADAGEVTIFGDRMDAADITPAAVHEAGVRVVHQDLALFDRATIAENFAFDSGFPTGRGSRISWSGLNRRVAALLEEYDIPARPQDLVGSLRPAQKTLVAVARALQDQRGAEMVLLLDEPTASLPEHESRQLLRTLRERAALGQTIAIVTHRLPEVMAVADDITVFRDGKVAATLPAAQADHDTLVSYLAGRDVERTTSQPAADVSAVSRDRAPLLELRDIVAGPLAGLDLTVRSGEVVGIVGLLGSGRSTALNVAFGAVKPRAGQVRFDGEPVRLGHVGDAIRRGVAMVPENRLRDAAFARHNVRENASASVLGRFWTLWMRRGRERTETRDLITTYGVKASSTEAPFMSLSGGNQQKVVLARWMRRQPRLLLLDEPTQGVDVVARGEIYQTVRAAARRGCGVLVASSDHEEVVLLCDRVIVLAGGKIAAELVGESLTDEQITHQVQSVTPSLETSP